MNWRLCILILVLATPVALAQSSSKKAQHTQSINFNDELIQGNIQKPDMFYLMQKRDFNFKRLIKLRNNFLPEMNQTAQDIGRNKPGT